jgi:hypothetical protein
MCNTCKPLRFVMDIYTWHGSRVSRNYYRIRDNKQKDYHHRPLIIVSGNSFSDIQDICTVLNAEEERRRPSPCCCQCHQQ